MANIRFSEWRLGSEAGKKTVAMAFNKNEGGYGKYDEAAVKKAILACDIYVAFEGHKNTGEDTSETKGMDTVSDDLFDTAQDFSGNDSATQYKDKNYSNGVTNKYAQGLPLSAYNKRTGVWDMEKALSTGEKVFVSTTDPLYERTALNNEIILINTFTYLSGKTAKPKVLARPAYEYNGELNVSDEPMTMNLIATYFNVYFTYVVRVAMYDVISPYNSDQGKEKWDNNKKALQKRFADKAAEKGFDVDPNKDWDKATLKDGMARRKYGISKVLGVDPDDLTLGWFFTLSAGFLVDGFWETVESGSALTKVRYTKDEKTGETKEENVEKDVGAPQFQTHKGVLLDDKFQSMISSVDNLIDNGFSINYYDDADSDLMNWIANALRLRFNYYKKVIFTQAARTYKVSQTASSDELQDTKGDKEGANRLEREMFKAGAYEESPEDEIATNQSIDAFFKKEKYWLTDEVENFNDTFPILRYMAAMIEYPCSSGTTILNAVGVGHINNGSKHINNWASTFAADRPAPKGSMAQLSIEVVKKLKKYDLLQLFMGLINNFRGDSYRAKILNGLNRVYTEFEGIPDESATIPLTFKVHTQSEVEAINKKGTQGWYLVDNLFVQRSIDKWDNYTKPLEGTENENLIELGENMIYDACDKNMNAIVPSFYYSPVTSLMKKYPDLKETLDAALKQAKDAEKKQSQDIKDEDKARQNKEISDTFFNGKGVPGYVNAKGDEGELDAVNESLFDSIHKSYMKNKLFETIYNKAQKRD